MSITSDVFNYLEPRLKKAPNGLMATEIEAGMADKYKPSQVRGALCSLMSAGKIRRIKGTGKTSFGDAVAFTLPNIPLTAHLPDYTSEKHSSLRRKILSEGRGRSKPKAKIKSIDALLAGSDRHSVATMVIDAHPELGRSELSLAVAESLSIEHKPATDIINKLITKGTFFRCGTVRKGKLIRPGNLNLDTVEKSDEEIIELVRANPIMPRNEFHERIGMLFGFDAATVHNRIAKLIGAGRLDTLRGRLIIPNAEEAASVNEPIPAPTPAPSPLKAEEPAHVKPIIQQYVQDDFLASIRANINAIASSIAHSIAEQIGREVTEALARLHPQSTIAAHAAPAAPVPVKPKLKKVVVLGLLGQQAGMLQQEFPMFEFNFIGTDELGGRGQDAIRHAEHVYGMTKFISHAAEGKVKDHPHYERIPGGLSMLRDAMRRLAHQQVQ